MEKALNKCLAQAKESDTTITTQLQEGDPASVILEQVLQANTI